MEKEKRCDSSDQLKTRLIRCSVVVVLNTAASSCSLTAEFHKAKVKDMKLDGSLCSLPKTPAFGLAIAAIACASVAQIVGTVVGGARVYAMDNNFDIRKNRIAPAYLISSWLCYGLAAVILGTGASMNNGQPYGKGWMDGDCYVVKNGIFGGAAALTIITSLLIFGFTSTLLQHRGHWSTSPDVAVVVVQDIHKQGQ